VIKEAFKRVL